MVETRLNLEPEVQEIFKIIDLNKNFLLSGGAGSGKTFSLVQIIQQIIKEDSTIKIACITYTNAAVKEIEERVCSVNLVVSTIHDFLWDNIKNYQKELKKSLVELINLNSIQSSLLNEDVVENNYFFDKKIQYKEYTKIQDGIISHDELIVIAYYMFSKYSKLSDILKSKFKFIFIDEYQDTSPKVIEIILTHLKNSNRTNVIGFFGDSMQAIYEGSVGNLNSYIQSGCVQEVQKRQNRRNPSLVYELANELREDGIVQVCSTDNNAPNMENGVVKKGNIQFYYSEKEDKFDDLKKILKWDSFDKNETKELNLTHNLIASKAGFEKLMAIYDGDKILEYKKRILDYIKKNEILDDFINDTFEQVINKLKEKVTCENELRQVSPTTGMQNFIDANPLLYAKALQYPFKEFQRIYVNKDALMDDNKLDESDPDTPRSKRDNLIKHLFKIQNNISLYEQGKYNKFLRKTELKISSINDKIKIKSIIKTLHSMSNNKIVEVIDYADSTGLCIKDDKLNQFIYNNAYIYDQVKDLYFSEFINLYNYLEGSTPFSTQHKIKGMEFDNVIIILDNGNWNMYNFKYLFENSGTPNVLERTRKIFYVCCTRAKENLVVYFHKPSSIALSKAKEWFGEENVILLE